MKNIHDIAQMAGVSKSTVSRYLNGGSISEKTRLKIDRIVEETGYKPNQFAQSLKAKHTQMMGVIIPRLSSFASSETLNGIETYLREKDYQTIIVNTDLSREREIQALYTLAKNKVDGILLFATELTEAHVAAIEIIDVPVILIGQSHQGIHAIVQNDYEAGKTVGQYLGHRGFSHIAYLGVSTADKAVGIHRKNGVVDGLAMHGVRPDIYETTFKLQDAHLHAKELVNRYEAVICATDNIALGTLKAAYDKELNVPSDLSIIGFGGYDTTSIVTPMITTIQFPYQQTGRLAAESILKLINHQTIAPLQRMSFSLLEKESVDNKNNKE
ncbi:LacI family transcriptional regulator [Macrococcus hajekii]|uniref:LacI family transcriptional regulator n=1 Tax=Macrococcus hajekii TaxID=198482 RepID=A0A4R6BID0_9STAP|nr:LacI family DNA-binding transcriptional regulator [Macrococcus hajekii]TDM01383.1 LacI family transcriptional regulator [Macrococcus hajekii]GGB11132.1 LacI family transcriptional regulator [Macrococcus hajekii]